jgi:ankyrin repeat protein
VQIGDIQKVQEVLRHNPGILNEGDDLGWTILHEAARAGNLELVELCITRGADKDSSVFEKVGSQGHTHAI